MRVSPIWVAIGLILVAVTPTSSTTFEWDGECTDQNGSKEWLTQCPAGTTNWNGDPQLPGEFDDVVVPMATQNTTIQTFDVEVNSAAIANGLILDQTLRLHASSAVSNLQMLLAGEIRMLNASTQLIIDGNSNLLAGNLYGPGEVVLNGTGSLNGLKIRDNAVLINVGTATLSAGTISISTESSELLNGNSLTITGGVLSDGVWVASQNGEIDFPEPVHTLGSGAWAQIECAAIHTSWRI